MGNPTVDDLVKEAIKRCKDRIRGGEKAKDECIIGSGMRKKWL